MIDYRESDDKKITESIAVVLVFCLLCLWLAVAIMAPMALIKFCYFYLHG